MYSFFSWRGGSETFIYSAHAQCRTHTHALRAHSTHGCAAHTLHAYCHTFITCGTMPICANAADTRGGGLIDWEGNLFRGKVGGGGGGSDCILNFLILVGPPPPPPRWLMQVTATQVPGLGFGWSWVIASPSPLPFPSRITNHTANYIGANLHGQIQLKEQYHEIEKMGL